MSNPLTQIRHMDGPNATFHPVKKTLPDSEVRPRTKEIWRDLTDILRNEEAWAIIQHHLDMERLDAMGEAFCIKAEESDCECKFDDNNTLVVCEKHAKEILKAVGDAYQPTNDPVVMKEKL